MIRIWRRVTSFLAAIMILTYFAIVSHNTAQTMKLKQQVEIQVLKEK